MKKVIITSRRPETSQLLAVMLNMLFPECEICISEDEGVMTGSSLASVSMRKNVALEGGNANDKDFGHG